MPNLLRKTMKAGSQLAEAVPNTECVKAVSEAVEEGMEATRRAVKRGREAAEDLVEEATHNVKRYPLQSLAITFGVAFWAGALAGWFVARRK